MSSVTVDIPPSLYAGFWSAKALQRHFQADLLQIKAHRDGIQDEVEGFSCDVGCWEVKNVDIFLGGVLSEEQ